MQQELLENLSFSGRSDIRYICVKGRTGDSARLERKYDAHKKLKFTQNTFTLLEKFLILLQRNPCQKMVIINKQSLMQCMLATRATLLVCQTTYSYTWAHFSSQGIFAGIWDEGRIVPFPNCRRKTKGTRMIRSVLTVWVWHRLWFCTWHLQSKVSTQSSFLIFNGNYEFWTMIRYKLTCNINKSIFNHT